MERGKGRDISGGDDRTDGTIAPTYGEYKEGMDARGCLIKRAEELTG
jgi:hypothetical protein